MSFDKNLQHTNEHMNIFSYLLSHVIFGAFLSHKNIHKIKQYHTFLFLLHSLTVFISDIWIISIKLSLLQYIW